MTVIAKAVSVSTDTPTVPRISVVICTHNRGFYLRKAITSVLAQDMPASEYELIIIDNKSTDDTAQVVASFAAANVRYIHEPQLGLCFARNTGWYSAAGTYVAYLDDDAIAEPDETAICTLSANANYTVGSPSTGTVVVHSNE